jgi:hypothetical protein
MRCMLAKNVQRTVAQTPCSSKTALRCAEFMVTSKPNQQSSGSTPSRYFGAVNPGGFFLANYRGRNFPSIGCRAEKAEERCLSAARREGFLRQPFPPYKGRIRRPAILSLIANRVELNEEAAELAAQITRNFEELGI